jgi:hypothetical protein
LNKHVNSKTFWNSRGLNHTSVDDQLCEFEQISVPLLSHLSFLQALPQTYIITKGIFITFKE